jgi:hypothetical protein
MLDEVDMNNDKIRILALLDDIAFSKVFTKKLELFQMLKLDIIDHILVEELSYLSRDLSSVGLSVVQEHHDIKNYLQKLNLLNAHEEQWEDKFQKLKLIIQNHFEIQENMVKLA